LTDMIEIIRRYHITLPAQAALLIKTLITLEGTVKLLNARFSLLEVMQPFHRRLMIQRLSPARQWRKLRRVYFEVEQLAEVLPSRIIEIMEQIQSGQFDVHLDHRGLEPSVNRLVLGMLTSALFLGSALMISMHVPPLLPNWAVLEFFGMNRQSILGFTGATLSVLLGLRVLRAIGKSGHLDRKH
jgi:ubiquinone biosynthesis protein